MFSLINCSSPINWIISSVLLTVLLQSTAFLVSHLLQIDLIIDLAGSVNFFVLGLIGLLGCHRAQESIPLRSLILFGMVAVWAIRLGIFQFMRLWKKRQDGRFDAIRADPMKFAAFWSIQALWIVIVSLPLTMINGSAASASFKARSFGFLEVVGFLIWAFGFYFEVRADHEKYIFSLIPSTERTLPFITTGMWSFSRHPNYFGEIVLWIGFWIASARAIGSWSLWALLISLGVPCFVFFLIVRVSGIPIAETNDDRRYSKLLAYQQYKAITSPLIPISPKIYAYIHPRIKAAFFFERNSVSMPTQVPKIKHGSPIQYSSQSSR